jgi:hypothetical protein
VVSFIFLIRRGPESYLRRRDFIKIVGGAAVAWPLAAVARHTMPFIGFLSIGSLDSFRPTDAFSQALSEAGYFEGKNITIEYRWRKPQNDRVPAQATYLINRQVEIIGVAGNIAIFVTRAGGFLFRRDDQIIALAACHALPTIYAFPEFTVDGGFIKLVTETAFRLPFVELASTSAGFSKPKNLAHSRPHSRTDLDWELRL